MSLDIVIGLLKKKQKSIALYSILEGIFQGGEREREKKTDKQMPIKC